MRYYSYQVKMKDLRGGMTGFQSPQQPVDVDGVAHVIVKDETKMPESYIKFAITMMAGTIIVSQNISRPLTDAEYGRLPQNSKAQLEKNNICMAVIPHWHKDPFWGTLSS